MVHINEKIDQLKDDVVEMMFLVKSQLEKGQEALLEFDEDLAHEIVVKENRVNALELKIDSECESILALHNPVANDLRFVLACYKINSDAERLGDNANSIAGYILELEEPLEKEALEKMRIEEMYSTAATMMSHVFNAFINEDTDLARKVFKLDEVLNEINENASAIITELIHEKPEKISAYLYMFSIIRKLERAGDMTKNVAEEITYYIEAKILKHKKPGYKQNHDDES